MYGFHSCSSDNLRGASLDSVAAALSTRLFAGQSWIMEVIMQQHGGLDA